MTVESNLDMILDCAISINKKDSLFTKEEYLNKIINFYEKDINAERKKALEDVKKSLHGLKHIEAWRREQSQRDRALNYIDTELKLLEG